MDEAQKKKILRQRYQSVCKEKIEVDRKLAIANKTIYLQMEQIDRLNKFVEFKETEARLQDNAIDRNTTIIHYLESKIVDMISEYNKA